VSTAASSFFHCRVCGHTQYSPVRTRLSTGSWEATGYWKCMGCSVMFVDPKAFSSQRIADEAATGTADAPSATA
jgi:hypothetical protein